MNVFIFFWTFKMNWRDWLLQTNWLQMLRAPKHFVAKSRKLDVCSRSYPCCRGVGHWGWHCGSLNEEVFRKFRKEPKKNNLFICIKIPEVPVKVSSKGGKEKNIRRRPRILLGYANGHDPSVHIISYTFIIAIRCLSCVLHLPVCSPNFNLNSASNRILLITKRLRRRWKDTFYCTY